MVQLLQNTDLIQLSSPALLRVGMPWSELNQSDLPGLPVHTQIELGVTARGNVINYSVVVVEFLVADVKHEALLTANFPLMVLFMLRFIAFIIAILELMAVLLTLHLHTNLVVALPLRSLL